MEKFGSTNRNIYHWWTISKTLKSKLKVLFTLKLFYYFPLKFITDLVYIIELKDEISEMKDERWKIKVKMNNNDKKILALENELEEIKEYTQWLEQINSELIEENKNCLKNYEDVTQK